MPNTNNTFLQPVVLSPEAFHVAVGGALGKNRIYQLLHAGRLRHVRIGSRFLILATETEAFFEREAVLVADTGRWSA